MASPSKTCKPKQMLHLCNQCITEAKASWQTLSTTPCKRTMSFWLTRSLSCPITISRSKEGLQRPKSQFSSLTAVMSVSKWAKARKWSGLAANLLLKTWGKVMRRRSTLPNDEWAVENLTPNKRLLQRRRHLKRVTRVGRARSSLRTRFN